MGIFKDTHSFSIRNVTYTVEVGPSKLTANDMHAVVKRGEEILAKDSIEDAWEDDRKLLLTFNDAQHNIRIDVGAIDLIHNTAIVVHQDNKLIYESHPGKKVISWTDLLSKQAGLYIEEDESLTDKPSSSSSDSLDERDKTFDTVSKAKRSYTGLFLAAILIVAAWNIFTNRPGIDTVIMASAVFVSGVAAHTLLRVPTISGGAVGIAAFLLSYGLFQQFVLGNGSTNKLGFTFTALSIIIGHVVYYVYYRLVSNRMRLVSSNQTLPNSEIRRSLIFFTVLAFGNTVFALFASDELFGLWSLAALVSIFYYIFSPYMKSRNPARPNPRKGTVSGRLKSKKFKSNKKTDSDDNQKSS